MVLYTVRNIYRRGHEGNTEKENNGYVVFKGNILGQAGEKSGGEDR
jgi:hypothetical protein